MTHSGGWNEERVLRWLKRELHPRGVLGSFGNDACVLSGFGSQRTVACTDQVIVGVHCEPATSAARVGRKACARTLSDLAASAASPRAVLLAICAPADTREAWIRACVRAVDACAREYGAELVGGDLAAGDGPARLAVTALGTFPERGLPPARDRARAGQLVVATGSFGGSRLGRHLKIEPRIEQGRWLHEHGATAMMDISDGLARDLARLARASQVGIDLDSVPIHGDARRAARASGEDPLVHALNDGEDHELVATLSAAAWRRSSWAGDSGAGLSVIGRVRAGRGVRIRQADGSWSRWDGQGGWVHGAG